MCSPHGRLAGTWSAWCFTLSTSPAPTSLPILDHWPLPGEARFWASSDHWLSGQCRDVVEDRAAVGEHLLTYLSVFVSSPTGRTLASVRSVGSAMRATCCVMARPHGCSSHLASRRSRVDYSSGILLWSIVVVTSSKVDSYDLYYGSRPCAPCVRSRAKVCQISPEIKPHPESSPD